MLRGALRRRRFSSARWIPFLADLEPGRWSVVALLFAATLTVNSPMVTLALLTETRAEGPLARTTLGVVLVADVVVVLLFTGAFSLAQASLGGATAERRRRSWCGSCARCWGRSVAGVLIGGVLSLYLRFVRRELVLFAVVRRVRHRRGGPGAPLRAAPEPAGGRLPRRERGAGPGRAAGPALHLMAVPVFVIFFAMAGAELRLQAFAALWPLVLGAGAARGAGRSRGRPGRGRVGRGGAGGAPVRLDRAGLPGRRGARPRDHRGGRLPRIGRGDADADRRGHRLQRVGGPVLFRRGLERAGEIR